MEEDGEEDEPAEGGREGESGADGDAVKEGVDGEAGEDGVAGFGGDELAGVGFFAEVEVGVDGVLEEVDGAVAGHDEDGGEFGVELEALWEHFEDGGGHEEAGAEGDEVAEIFLDSCGADEDEAADDVGQGGYGSEEDGEFEHLSVYRDEGSGVRGQERRGQGRRDWGGWCPGLSDETGEPAVGLKGRLCCGAGGFGAGG